MNFKTYKGETLRNVVMSIKIDGVCAFNTAEGVVSRTGKPLHNLQNMDVPIAEVFLGSWEDTISAVRTHNGTPVKKEHIYSLQPLDPRLYIGTFDVLTKEDVDKAFSIVKGKYEGLVLFSDGIHYKVKAKETFDVAVTDVLPGKGKHTGRMGALMTYRGKVGTGFTDEDRQKEWPIGAIIEVECMSLTPSGKFRHPRYIRRRFDKE